MILFAFRNTIAEKVLRKISVENKFFIDSSEKDINQFVETISKFSPTYIVGLGEYFGRDQDNLRIETICTNKFKNQIADNSLEQATISSFLMPSIHSKYATGIGNSYCNLVSYKLSKSLGQSQYGFIHIPKGFDEGDAAREIETIIGHIL